MNASRNPALDHVVSPASECLGVPGVDLEVKVQFRRSGYQALQGVTCEFHEGTARIRGHLPTFYLKQIAQEIVCAVVGVRSVVNQIEVGPRRAPDAAARAEPDRIDSPDATGYQP
jgi:osmotically-inducible protein OsmY